MLRPTQSAFLLKVTVLAFAALTTGFVAQQKWHDANSTAERKQFLENDIAWYGGKPTAPVSFEIQNQASTKVFAVGQRQFANIQLQSPEDCQELQVRLRSAESLELISWNGGGEGATLTLDCKSQKLHSITAELQLKEESRGLLVADIKLKTRNHDYEVSKSISFSTPNSNRLAISSMKSNEYYTDSQGNRYHVMASSNE